MKHIQNSMFTVKQKPKRSFKIGETYKIYYINPNVDEGVDYVFISKDGNITENFSTTAEADAIIDKMQGSK